MTTDRPFVLEDCLTRAELARALGKSERTIKRYEDEGLPVSRRGNLRLYWLHTTRDWLRGKTTRQRRASAPTR
jgi:hypothetical protein